MDWFILAFISALFSAASAMGEKKALFSIDALEFSFLVSAVSFAISIPFFAGTDPGSLSSAGLLILYIKTVLGVLAFLFVMMVIKNLEISEALPLMILTPVFVAVFAFIFIGDALGAEEITGITLLLAGTYILENAGKRNLIEPFTILFKSKQHRYVLLALLLFTVTSILDRYLITDFKLTPENFMAFQQLFFAVNFLLLFLILRKFSFATVRSVNSNLWFWIFLVGFMTVVYRYAQIEAIKLAPVALVLSVKRISVFFSTIIGGKIFNDQHLLRKAAATAIMVAGAILLIRFGS